MVLKIDLLKIVTALLIYVALGGFLFFFVTPSTPLENILKPFIKLLEFNLAYISLFIISMYISFKYVETE